MTEKPPRPRRRRYRANRDGTPLTDEDKVWRDFLKKFKEDLQVKVRYSDYFFANDKVLTFARIKALYKKEVLEGTRTEEQFQNALHIMLTLGWEMSDARFAEALERKPIPILPID